MVCRPIILSVANIMNENFMRFPVSLTITPLEDKNKSRSWKTKSKKVDTIYRNWKQLEHTVDVQGCKHYGIHTGAKNNITVIDFEDPLKYSHIVDKIKGMSVTTPSGATHFYFDYEVSLNTIYHALDGVSVINDRGCVFFGTDKTEYKPMNEEYPISKMPETLFKMLTEAQQQRPEEVVYDEIYELCSILPDCWFNEYDTMLKLVHVMRNHQAGDKSKLQLTLRRLLEERSDNYHERVLRRMYELPMNNNQQRFGLCALTKIIKKEFPNEYAAWVKKWNPSKRLHRGPRLKYKEGAEMKLSDITKRYKTIDAAKLLQMNSKFTISQKHICKSCLNRHRAKCCANYHRKVSTTCQFVNNIEMF